MSDVEDIIVCYVCNKAENDASRTVECVHCCKSAHFKCLKIVGTAATKAKRKPFFCTVVCAEIYAKSTAKQSGYDDVIKELRRLGDSIREVRNESTQTRNILEHTRSQIEEVVVINKHVEESQNFLAEKFEELRSELTELKTKQTNLMAETKSIRKEIGENSQKHQQLAAKVDDLEVEVDTLRRESLSKNAVILGLPAVANENVKILVAKVGAAVGCNIPIEDITDAHRIVGKNAAASVPPILVTFSSVNIKEQMFECKRNHGILSVSSVDPSFANCVKKITIRDELTAFGRGLLDDAKKLQQDLGIKYVWPGRNGAILLKRNDGAKIESIRSRMQLQALSRSGVQKRGLNMSTSSTNSNSPSNEPNPKRANVAGN